MARPVKWRKVEYIPNVQNFMPASGDTEKRGENILQIEELEAIRLKDLEGLEQEDCAEKMEVSRQTFQRIISTARKKVADSLVNGKAIRIEGGNFTLNICPVKCTNCGREWSESYENFNKVLKGELACPGCNSSDVVCARREMQKFCKGHCRRHGHP